MNEVELKHALIKQARFSEELAERIMPTHVSFHALDWLDQPRMSLERSPYPGKLSTPSPRSAARTAVLEQPSKSILQRAAIADVQPVDDTDLQASLALEAEALLGYSVLRETMKLVSPLAAALKKLEIEPFSYGTVMQYKLQMAQFAAQEAQKKNPYAYAVWDKIPIAKYRKPVPQMVLNRACEIKREVPAAGLFIQELNIHPDPFLVAELGSEEFYVEVWDEPKFEAGV